MNETVTGEKPFSFTSGTLRLAGSRWEPDDPVGTIVLLHGGGQTRHAWDSSAIGLSRRGWRVLTYDARGHGDSDWSSDGEYGTLAGAADLRALIELDGRVPVLVGASMGGMVSLVAAGSDPTLAQAVVLVDIVARVERTGTDRIRAFMTAHPAGFASLEEVADAVQAYSPLRRRPRNLDGVRKNVRLRADGRWYWHWDPAFLAIGDEPDRDTTFEQATAAAATLSVPTLIVRGSHSDIVSDEGVREMRELVPHAEYVSVRAGHMVAGDDNEVFTEAVTTFFDRHVLGSRSDV